VKRVLQRLALLLPTVSPTAVLTLALLAQAPASVSLAVCASPGSSGAGGTLTGVVNTYFASPATASVAAGATSLPLGTVSGAATSIKAGDLLLVIQTQGAAITTTNSTAYGANNASGRGATAVAAGRYEYVTATGAGTAGGSVPVTATINAYSASAASTSAGRAQYQVVVVPQYSSATAGAALKAKTWDGASGGILAIDVSNTLTLSGTVDVSGQGFRGGGGRALAGIGAATTATNADYVNTSTLNVHGSKAEGYAGTPRYTFTTGAAGIVDNSTPNGAANPQGYPGSTTTVPGDTARGAPGNAGGGGTDGNVPGNDDNSGGGGGGNGGTGGLGGNSYGNNLAVGGLGGAPTPFTAARLFLGGGGGAGSRNNGTAGSAESSGGSGGGLVFFRAGTLAGSGSVLSNGGVGVQPVNDGGGGGGAGGSILVYAAASTATATLSANGGAGTDADTATTNEPHGPGGGGAGGVVYTNLSTLGVSAALGVHGATNNATAKTGNAFGSADGTVGATSTALTRAQIPGVTPADACTPGSTTPGVTKQQQNVTTGTALGTGTITVKPGDTVRYVLTASNSTFKTQTAFVFRDPLAATLNAPASGTLTCPDGTTRSVTLGAQTVSVNLISSCGQTLNPGQTASLNFTTTVR